MKKKRKLNEKMGGGARIGLGGMNSDGPHYPRHKTKYPTGYHSGGYTGNADSQISQRHSLATLLEKEEELESYLKEKPDDLNENILEYRVKSKTKYMLIETLNIVKSDQLLKESAMGKAIQKWITLALMVLLDDVTGELSGMIAVVPLLYKNVYEIHTTNKTIEQELAKPKPNVKLLKKLRADIIRDITDIVNALLIAIPGLVFEDSAAFIFSLLNDSAVGSVSELFLEFSKTKPRLSHVFHIIAYPLGGKVIFQGMKNIDRLNDLNINNTIANTGLPPDTEIITNDPELDNVIDVTNDMTVLEAVNTDVYKVMCETAYSKKNISKKSELSDLFSRIAKLPAINEKKKI
jgi:hypothetical protein